MNDTSFISPLVGVSLLALVSAPPALAVAEHQPEADQPADGGGAEDRSGDRLNSTELDTAPQPEETVSHAVDTAHSGAADADRRHRAVDTVDRAYDAALIRTDIELDTEHDAERSLLEDESVQESLDADRVQRLRAFFDQFAPEDGDEAPAPLVRLREVGNRIAESGSTQLHLQPYVPAPEWIDAMELLADDDCDDALEKATELMGPAEVHADGEPGVAYAFARMKMCSSNADHRAEGRAMMRDLADIPSPIGRLASRQLGGATSAEYDDGATSISGHLSAARSRAADGDVDGALADLNRFRDQLDRGWHRHRVRLTEARILEDAGRIDEAALAYRAVYRKTSGWRASDRIASRIEDAEDRLGRTIITFGDRVDRIRALISRGRYRQAREVSRENVDIRGVSGREVRGWTRFRQGLQNERQRNRERAVEQFEEADDLIEDEAVRPRLYFGWARAERRTGGDEHAVELYDRICEEYPGHRLCTSALYEAGRLLQYRNRHDEARQRFERLATFHPFHDRAPNALWRYAFSAYLQGDHEDALAPLETIVDHYGDIEDSSELTAGLRATYWLGVNHLELGNETEARLWLQRAIDDGPLTWYGRLAVERMRDTGLRARVPRPITQLTQSEIEDLANIRIPDNPRLAPAAELARVGLYQEALQEVRDQLDVHPAPEGGTQLRAALHLAVDEPHWAHWIMKSVIDESGPTHSSLHDWGLAFPLNYFELSHRYGDRYGVSPHLVHAIMRQESGFRPEVASPAGAIGLMQLMPGTARYTSRNFFDEGRLSRSQILDEETNVRLGTVYIRVHLAHASGHTPLALAGYNAGPASLQSWFDRYGDRQVDAWVESITFNETRGYVRKVMTSYITYQGLYGDGELPDIKLEMPDELRDWGEVPEVEDDEPISMVVN